MIFVYKEKYKDFTDKDKAAFYCLILCCYCFSQLEELSSSMYPFRV